MRVIYLPAIDKRVSLRAYVAAVRLAKANPTRTFTHGLTSWWPTTGAEIMRQFYAGLTERINDGISYTVRGTKASMKLQGILKNAKLVFRREDKCLRAPSIDNVAGPRPPRP